MAGVRLVLERLAGTSMRERPKKRQECRCSLFLAGFFEGFGHGFIGEGGFGDGEVALGGVAAFGRDLARKGEAAGLDVGGIGDKGGGVVRVDAHVRGGGDGVMVGTEEQKPLNCSRRWRRWSWTPWSRNGRG